MVMNNFEAEDLIPMPPAMGPPLPRFLQIYWPWFSPPPPGTYRLTVFRVGNGIVTPGSGDYEAGAMVTLTAVPDTGAVFDHWSGDATGTNPGVGILMDRNKEVTAHFVGGPPVEREPIEITWE
ncbi:hypothetical protein LCGC14_0263510 [marine sediment metagenome]|uniref:Bacterial repeat domain-containing protein n=1 Tax=marine sediment metagenome TaxID=412755 RepID=A0A0F9WLZ7_9ZZZZ